jgi:ferric-dicitrate binding protein FerR (iron transport regulator)
VNPERSGRASTSEPIRRPSSPWRRRLRAVLLSLIALLYVVSIPWYRPSGEVASVVWGLPDWVSVALACYVAAALLNAVAWLATDVPERDSAADEDEVR